MHKHDSSSRLRFYINKLNLAYHRIFSYRKLINQKMEEKFTPHRLALVVAFGVGVIWFLMLIITPAHGLADDSTLASTLSRNGLSYLQTNPEEIYNNYFIRTYALEGFNNSSRQEIANSQDVVIKTAILLDKLVTHNDYFDIRFLALIYGLFYLLGIYRLVKSIITDMYYFSEAIVIAIITSLIFGDISYLAYFNSFYPEAIWLVCFVHIVGAVSAQHLIKKSYFNLLIILIAGTVLCLSRQQCGIIGIIIAMYLLRVSFFHKETLWRMSCIILAFVMSMVSMISINTMASDFSLTSKYHSMTRGVLFQSSNPETTLTDFGINPSYSVLANTSAYNYYPFVLPENQLLKEGFFNQYDAFDIAAYYIKNPGSFFNMMDIAIKETMDLRRDFCGNFEQIQGMPKGAKSIMWSGWSFFKVRSLPKTIGYLFVLLIAAYVMYIRSYRNSKHHKLQQGNLMFLQVLLIVTIGGSQVIISIIMSGAAELGQHAFLMGAALDMTIFLLFSEVLVKMNILETKEGEV